MHVCLVQELRYTTSLARQYLTGYTVPMSWAARRRFIILFILGAVAVAFIAIVGIATFSKAPSCSDGVQNQGEDSIDCGGPCPYLCVEEQHAPTVLFTKAIPNGAGRTDVIASIENINAAAAAKNVPYTITLYGAGQVYVQQVTGTLDLPPASTVPVFVPGISSGNQKTIRAFLTIASSSPDWFTMRGDSRARPIVVNTTIGGATSTPRIDATLGNSGVTPLTNVRTIVLVRDEHGEVIAASQTIVPTIPAQGEATATFTWNSAFPSAPARIEVLPVILLP